MVTPPYRWLYCHTVGYTAPSLATHSRYRLHIPAIDYTFSLLVTPRPAVCHFAVLLPFVVTLLPCLIALLAPSCCYIIATLYALLAHFCCCVIAQIFAMRIFSCDKLSSLPHYRFDICQLQARLACCPFSLPHYRFDICPRIALSMPVSAYKDPCGDCSSDYPCNIWPHRVH